MNTQKAISVSSLGTFLGCPRRFFYSHEMRWIPQQEADALSFGKAWHSLLEYYGKSGEAYSVALMKWLDLNEEQIVNALNDEAFAMLVAMAFEFDATAKNMGEIFETEAPFSFRIPSTHWRVNGIIDAIHHDGFPIEYKTTSSTIEPGDFYWLRLKANLQAITYAIITEANTVRYVVARKPRLQRKQVPLLDENGNKIVTYADGMRAFNKNGTPRQTGGDGLIVQSRKETNDEYIERMRGDLKSSASFVVEDVAISDDAKMLAIETFTSGIRQIEILRKQAVKCARPDIPYIRNCTEWNCKNCPYQGICLDLNVNPTDGIPNGFQLKQ